MFGPRKVGGALIVLGLMSLPAAPAQACCGWFKGCGGCGTTANYAPYAVAYAPMAPSCAPCGGGCAPYAANYAPAPCGSCQTVNYMPQTCYRTVYYSAPVVAYSPVTACGPCGATTVMRPVTTYVTQARVVAYTMYRPVVAAMPVAYYAPVAQPAASYGTTGYSPTPAASPAPASNGATNSTPAAPSLPASDAAEPNKNKTFDEPAPSDPQSRIVLPPRNGSSNTSGPRVLDPEQNQDRTTAVPIRQAWAVRNASAITPAKPVTQQQDDGGWRSARH
jgi:hypothetical protein